MYFALRYTLLIAIPFLALLRTDSLAMERHLSKEADSSHKENVAPLVSAFLNGASDALQEEKNLAALAKTLMTSVADMPRFESLYNIREIWDTMIDAIEENNDWPKKIRLRYHHFSADSTEQAALWEALKVLLNLEQPISHTIHEGDEKKELTLAPSMKLENTQEFVALLHALNTLKDYRYPPSLESQAEHSVRCDTCKKICTAFTIDDGAVNPDLCIRLECGHIFHVACAVYPLAQSHVCPICHAPFHFEKTHIAGLAGNLTHAHIGALYELVRQPENILKELLASVFDQSKKMLTPIYQTRWKLMSFFLPYLFLMVLPIFIDIGSELTLPGF